MKPMVNPLNDIIPLLVLVILLGLGLYRLVLWGKTLTSNANDRP